MEIFISPMGLIGIVLLLWVGIGGLLLWFFARPAGSGDFVRTVRQYMVTRSEPVAVTLRLKPPVLPMEADTPHDVVLVLDHSSSMGAAPGSPLREAIRSMQNFVTQLPDNYRTGLVIFDHEAQILCPATSDPNELTRALGTIGPGGATAIDEALDKALVVLEQGRDGVDKTVVLLSDGGSDRIAAQRAAQRVKDHHSNPSIICVGFGPYVDEALLTAIADQENHFIHVVQATDLEPLFMLLARHISGAPSAGGLVEERIATPLPFRLDHPGGLSPLAVEPSRDFSKVTWSLVVLKESIEAIRLDYRLKPVCLGWHRVSPDGARALWTKPDGGRMETTGKAGPRILVLADGFSWMWPLMNPIFWIVFGRFFRCLDPFEPAPRRAELPCVQQPTLPTPIEAPDLPTFIPKLKPALVIGLGALGEWCVTRLKWRVLDRRVDPQGIDLIAVSDSGIWSRPPVEYHGVSLEQSERLILQQDLRPYLEALRNQGTPATRQWLPLREWLRSSLPMTYYGDDRRKARLALLLDPVSIEQSVAPIIDRIRMSEGIIIVVADPNEAEGSGLLAEFAHLCATFSKGVEGVTAVLSPNDEPPSGQCVGMVDELGRLLSMRGEAIYSDRGGKTQEAKQLFDRVVLTEAVRADSQERSKLCEHLVWDLLAFPKVLEQLPALAGDRCYQISLLTQYLPQLSLWEWVRERTLNERLNGQWLGVDIDEYDVKPPQTPAELVAQYVDAFWNSENLPGRLLQQSALVRNKSIPFVLTEDLTGLPFEHSDHEQRIYCDGERHYFAAYLKLWCDTMLGKEAERHQWGLPTLLEAVIGVEQDIARLIAGAEKMAGNVALAPRIKLVSELYLDYQSALAGLRSALDHWVTFFIGWRPAMMISPPPAGYVPVAVDIEAGWRKAESNLVFNKKELLETAFHTWTDQYGYSLNQQLRFKVNPDHKARGFAIQLQIFDQSIDASSGEHSGSLADALRTALDRYQNVITQWPQIDWFDAVPSVRHSAQSHPIGRFGKRLYAGAGASLDDQDPFLAASITIQQMNLKDAFQLAPNAIGIYAWPEEANAARIATKIRNRLYDDPGFNKNPVIVSLMRDCEKLNNLMVDLSAGNVAWSADILKINRNGTDFIVGPTRATLTGIDLFHDLVRQVGVQGISWPDGIPLPSEQFDWALTPDQAVTAVEKHPLIRNLIEIPEWAFWREVIKGLVLEYSDHNVH